MGILRTDTFQRTDILKRKRGEPIPPAVLIRTVYTPTDLEPDVEAADKAIANIILRQLRSGTPPLQERV